MMKKVLSSLMALTLCISPVSGIHNVYAADSASSGVAAQKGTKATDGVYEAFESGAEKVGVMISFAYHNDDEAAQLIKDEADKYVDSLDKGMYTEEELHLMWCNYSNKLSYDRYGEYMCSILEESGLGDIFTLSAGNSLFCIVNEEQLGVLENNERVKKIIPRRDIEPIAELYPELFNVEPADEMITDPAIVKEMLSDFIEKAGLDAVFAEEGEYPEYTQPVLIEFPMGTIANTLIINYAYKANIASTTYDFIPMDNGMPITTSLNTETTATTTTTTTTTTPTTTTYIRSTPYGGISADSIPDEVTIHSGETVELDFTGCYLTGVKAVSSNENAVKAEAALDESSSVFINTGKITLTACNTEITITAEVEFFYDTFVPQDGGSKTIKVIVSGENDEPGTTDQSFVKELYADFPAGEKKGIFLRCYLAQNITFTSDCEYLRFERTGYNEPGRVQFSEAPNIIVIEEHYVNTPGSQTMFVYVDENAPTCKATVNMSYTSLSTGKEVKRSFDIDILSKEDAASTTTTTLPYTTTTTTTTIPDYSTTTIILTAMENDFSTVSEYNHSPMKIGETRPVYFYSFWDYKYAGLEEIELRSDCITYSYNKGDEVIYITAVSPGKAELAIRQEGTVSESVVHLTVIDEQYESETDKVEVSSDIRKRARLLYIGQTCVKDAQNILDYAAGKELPEKTADRIKERGDIDGSGEINALDASWLLAYLKDTRFPGDVDEDRKITATDASFVLKYTADISDGSSGKDTELAGLKCFTYGDMNGDGKITPADASLILVEYANISGDQE